MAVTEVEGTGVELTPEEQEARAALCYQIEARIKENIAAGREAAWELCRNAYEFDQENGWTALGYENQSEWLAQPEIGIPKSTFFKMVRRYRELVVRRQLEPAKLVELEPSKLDIVVPTIEAGKKKVDEVLEDVKTLGARDLREKYIGLRPVKPNLEDTSSANGTVVDGTATVIEDKPLGEMPFLDSAAHVDSFIDMGGDRRKAKRHFTKLIEDHPFFQAWDIVQRYVDKSEPVPEQTDAQLAWKVVCATLEIAFIA